MARLAVGRVGFKVRCDGAFPFVTIGEHLGLVVKHLILVHRGGKVELEDIIGSVSRGASAAQINEIPLETYGSAAGVVAAVAAVVMEKT